jgi:hypothetical protein
VEGGEEDEGVRMGEEVEWVGGSHRAVRLALFRRTESYLDRLYLVHCEVKYNLLFCSTITSNTDFELIGSLRRLDPKFSRSERMSLGNISGMRLGIWGSYGGTI